MNKEDFKAQANQTIDKISDHIDTLTKKKEAVDGKVQSEYEEAIKKLEKQKSNLIKRYEALEEAGEGRWKEAKSAFESASNSFKEGLSEISSLFSSKH